MTTLTENVLIVACSDATGGATGLRLTTAFGGYTQTEGRGAWLSPTTGALHTDPVAIFTVAAPHTAETRDTLRAIAREYCSASGEESAYLRFADGTVEFVGGSPA